MRGGKKGVPAGGYLGEFLEVHLKKYFCNFSFLCNRKMLFLMKKKRVFPWFLRFRLNSDFPNLNSCFKKDK